MKRRGLIIACMGAVVFGAASLAAGSIIESDLSGPLGFDAEIMLEGMFDESTDVMLVMPDGTASASYAVGSGAEPKDFAASDDDNDDDGGAIIMWAVRILDYVRDDRLSVHISGSDGEQYGMYRMGDEMNFGVADGVRADLLDITVTNVGDDPVDVVVMFSEDPENSDLFTDSDSQLNRIVVPLATAGIMALVGVVVAVVGIAIFLVDVRRQQQQRQNRMGRFDDWSDGR